MPALSVQPRATCRSHGPFVVHQQIPLGTCKELVEPLYEDYIFKQWCNRPGSWQLRLIGPPGSGKTMLSALTVQRLQRDFREKTIRVASIFLKQHRITDEQEFLRQFLLTILEQLLIEPASSDDSINQLSLHELKGALHKSVQSLYRAFLILDDVDACSQAVEFLETDLVELQASGLKIMTTSRMPLYVDMRRDVDCDTGDHKDIQVYWSCKRCFNEGKNFDWDEADLICQVCRDAGIPCKNCHRDDALFEPYSGIDLFLPAVLARNSPIVATFISQELETSHGDLHLGTIVPKPPLSPLGAELMANNVDVQSTVDAWVQEAASVISIVKLRLGGYEHAQTIEDLETIKDRIPDNFLTVFDALVEQISQKPPAEKKLGLAAVVLASRHPGKIMFKLLDEQLRQQGLLEPDTCEYLFRNLKRVLEATCGLLTVEITETSPVWPFHHLFRMYVLQDYNEGLYQAGSWQPSAVAVNLKTISENIIPNRG